LVSYFKPISFAFHISRACLSSVLFSSNQLKIFPNVCSKIIFGFPVIKKIEQLYAKRIYAINPYADPMPILNISQTSYHIFLFGSYEIILLIIITTEQFHES